MDRHGSMDEDGNYADDPYKIYEQEKSCEILKTKVEGFENRRKLGLEQVEKRRNEIWMTAMKDKERLDTVEYNQGLTENVAKSFAIVAAVLVGLRLVTSALEVFGAFWNRRKEQRKQLQVQNGDTKPNQMENHVGRDSPVNNNDENLKLHARHWQI